MTVPRTEDDHGTIGRTSWVVNGSYTPLPPRTARSIATLAAPCTAAHCSARCSRSAVNMRRRARSPVKWTPSLSVWLLRLQSRHYEDVLTYVGGSS